MALAPAEDGAGVSSIAGQAYVCVGDGELGRGSYHFTTDAQAYISYESEQCAKLFPRLDRSRPDEPGERIPRRMAFKDALYDPERRVFRGSVSFSRDTGSYEEVMTLDGIEREEYEMEFSEDFEAIVGGVCSSFCPNASKPSRVDRFGISLQYRRWSESPPEASPSVPAAASAEAIAAAGEPAVQGAHTLDAAVALWARDTEPLREALEAGAPVGVEVDAAGVWRQMRWDPGAEWRGAPPPRTSLLVAAILLQWPAGVELCIRLGADVNDRYAGPLRCKDGGLCGSPSAPTSHTVLRVALSARSQQQCLICRHVLDGRVDFKAFKRLRAQLQEEMEVDTRELLQRWLGPFLHQAAAGA